MRFFCGRKQPARCLHDWQGNLKLTACFFEILYHGIFIPWHFRQMAAINVNKGKQKAGGQEAYVDA